MYRKCVTEASARHQRQTEQALLTLMGRMAYEDISVTELCREAGITRRVFYHLFNNKYGALVAMIDHAILDIESYRPDMQWETLRSFLYWKDQEKLLDALRSNKLDGLLLERMIECVMSEGFDVRYWLSIRGGEEETDVVVFCLTGFMGLIYRWYYSGFRETPEEMAALLERIITHPFAAKAPGK